MFKIFKEFWLSTKISDLKFFAGKCKSDAKLNGKTVLITGCNTGIGKELAKDFYKRGARILMACRNTQKAEEAKCSIEQECSGSTNKGELLVRHLDLSNLENTRESAQEIFKSEPKIHMLVNNAGIFVSDTKYTDDGIEKHFGVNHLAPFLFTLMLIPRIIAAGSARIINISSIAHRFVTDIDFDDLDFSKSGYTHMKAYGQSKLANVLFTKELAKKFKEIGADVTTYAVHPGTIYTDVGRNFGTLVPWFIRPIFEFFANLFLPLFIKTAEQGIQTTLHCALTEEAGKETGLYYDECEVREPSDCGKNEELAKRLWDVSWKLTKLGDDFNPFKINKR